MKALLIISLLFSVNAFSEDDHVSKLRALNWKTTSDTYSISNDKAAIKTSSDEYLVIGDDAAEYMFLMQGHRGYSPDAAILRVRGDLEDSQVIYSINHDGYLTKDDWDENIDKDQMLDEIKDGTRESNKMRGDGYPDLFVDSWAQEPHLDKKDNTVYWAIEGHDSERNQFINAKALKLGREGYTEIIWIGTPDQFTSSEVVLEPVLANYKYQEGFRYADYIPGSDKLAAAGVGALVYKLATGKAVAKAGFIALAAIFAKKLWFLIFLPFMYVWRWLKAKFIKDSDK